MSNDLFKSVNFSAGQEVKASDLANISKMLMSRILDQIVAGKGANFGEADYFDLPGHLGANLALSPYAYALNPGGAYLRQGTTNARVQIAPGTLFQKVAASDGSDVKLLPYTFAGTEEWNIANGDVANPRVDLLQMKLELETGDTQSRVYEVDSIAATLDMHSVTTHFLSHYRAKARGKGGNHIQIRTVAGGAPAYAEAGNQITLTFVTGVTLDTALDALVAANSSLIEVDVAGTGAAPLTTPADVVGYTSLAGGQDSLLVSQNVDMQYRVKCTLTVKQGAPGASPAYPDPDAGCCVVGAVVVGANYIGAGLALYEDAAGAVIVVHDQRMPLGICPRTTTPYNAIYTTGDYALTGSGMLISQGAAKNIVIPHNGSGGRLVAAKICLYDVAAVTGHFVKHEISQGVGLQITDTNLNGSYANGASGSNFAYRVASLANIQGGHTPAAGPTVTANANGMGAPIWTNGKRAFQPDGTVFPAPYEHLAVKLACDLNVALGPYTFFVAEGL